MSKNYELGLYENGLSSLNEALLKFSQAQAGNMEAYKFAILHLVHSIELFLKHQITKIDSSLIFKPSKKPGDIKTITLWDAYKILNGKDVDFDPDFEKDLLYLTNLRNDIEHYKFILTISEANLCIGRIIFTLEELASSFMNWEIEDILNSPMFNIFKNMALEYEQRRERANRKIEDKIGKEYGYSPSDLMIGYGEFPVLDCPKCGEEALIPNDKSTTGWKCAFCEEENNVVFCIRCEEPVEPHLKGLCQTCINYLDRQ